MVGMNPVTFRIHFCTSPAYGRQSTDAGHERKTKVRVNTECGEESIDPLARPILAVIWPTVAAFAILVFGTGLWGLLLFSHFRWPSFSG
jgi:hypothetical protein